MSTAMDSSVADKTSLVNKRARQDSSILSGYSSNKLVINEPLCYIFKKYNQFPATVLKTIIIDFYDGDQINEAKDLLVSQIELSDTANWVKPPRRRKDSKENIGHKLRQDIDDILSQIQFVDENKLWNVLPIFVASNPDMLPSAKLTDGDLHCLMEKCLQLMIRLW
jgi:hypothetical protein